ncbi:MAG: chemotaxis protein CheC [Candidatus Methanomethyliaceae archaeon]|nr:chemotaxis protein CheC [Candidatus Methanomethyliaceae archaeon]
MENELLQRLNQRAIADHSIVGKITLAINKILPLKFYVTDIRITESDVNHLATTFALKEALYYLGIISKLSCSKNAYFLIFMDMASADELLCYLTGRHVGIINRFEESALQELTNIIVGTFISEIARRFDVRITYTVPKLAIETPSTLLNSAVKIIGSDKLYVSSFKLASEEPPIEIIASLLVPLKNGERFAQIEDMWKNR